MDQEIINKYYQLTPNQLLWFWENSDKEKFPLAKTFLHTHTDLGSPKDAILTVSDYVKIASEMGANSISVTDHGTMYAVPELYEKCQSKKIKLIIGVEFYVCDDVEDTTRKKHTRLHLIAYAKDKAGYDAIARLVTESNKRIISVGGLSFPCISKELLVKYAGKGSAGYGHIYFTSACIGGVLTGICYANTNNIANANVLQESIKEHKSAVEGYAMTCNTIAQLETMKNDLSLISGKTYGKRESYLKKHPEDTEAIKQLEAEKKETEDAKEEIKKINKRITANKKQKTVFTHQVEKFAELNTDEVDTSVLSDDIIMRAAMVYISKEERELEQLKAEIFDEEKAPELFEEEMLWYGETVGKENFFIELQYHRIEAETKYEKVIAEIGKKHGFKVVAANDAHQPYRESTYARKIANGLRFKNIETMWQDPEPSEFELYLKSDAELFSILSEAVGKEIAFEAMMNREIIVNGCNVELKKDPHYPIYPSEKELAA